MAVLGEESSQADGYLEEILPSGVIDGGGRYWIRQPSGIKIFDSEGGYVRAAGRMGRGPLEFSDPRPMRAYPDGSIAILDLVNARETVVDTSFELISETPIRGLAGFVDAVALSSPGVYAINAWLPAPATAGLPLHILEAGEIVRSFGGPSEESIQDAFSAIRRLAVDSVDRIYGMQRFSFDFEVWTREGERIASFSGPRLNSREVLPIPYGPENPPPNEVMDLFVDCDNRVWVLTRRIDDSWRDHFIERTLPNGAAALQLREDARLDDVYSSRIEVADLASGTIVARKDLDGLFSTFFGDGLVAQNRWAADGSPQIALWRASFHGSPVACRQSG